MQKNFTRDVMWDTFGVERLSAALIKCRNLEDDFCASVWQSVAFPQSSLLYGFLFLYFSWRRWFKFLAK